MFSGVGGVGASPATGGTGATDGVGGASGGSSGGGNAGGASPTLDCGMQGTWATFVEVGVEWESLVIRPGAGTVRQWILAERDVFGNEARDTAVTCGIESPFFSTILDSWIGVSFLDALFDSGAVPTTELTSTVQAVDPTNLAIGDSFEAAPAPLVLGIDGLDAVAPWPDVAQIQPFLRDHDQDTFPGITAEPLEGPVPGTPLGTMFSDPQLEIADGAPQASLLFMAIRVRAALRGSLTSCDPPRLEGEAGAETLQIQLRNVGCLVSGTSSPCSTDQAAFIDSNLPEFVPNGISVLVSIKVPPGTSCAEVRALDFQ